MWVTDADGTRYLDGYNNVPHVGHANPRVREAVCSQLGTLNVHTRYLNSRVLDYAERLLETFAAPIDRLFLTNSGSEANELALRLAEVMPVTEAVVLAPSERAIVDVLFDAAGDAASSGLAIFALGKHGGRDPGGDGHGSGLRKVEGDAGQIPTSPH